MSVSETVNAADPVAEADLSGRQIAGFRLLRRLGRGAMAEVYLATQDSLGRQVAIKILKSSLAGDDSYVRRFQNEARAAAALVHANIVQIYEVGSAAGRHYIAQEYVQGLDLQEWMTRHGPPPVRQALAIMRQVAAALHKASTTGIIHRDIKPENIMLAQTGEVKVADFGLARVAGSGAAPNLTQIGVTMGTPLYMSPEQVEGKPLDPRSDIYSFGVTCYQMLGGAPPFQGETALHVAVQHLNSQPKALQALRPDLPPALCRIVHRMLAKEPDDRYASARELLVDLRGLPTAGNDQSAFDDGAFDDVDPEPEFAAMSEATRRLAALSKTAALDLRRRHTGRRWLASALCLALLGGATIGWLSRRPFVLADAARGEVTKQASAQEQLYFAKLAGTEEWLKSVGRFFPEAEYEDRMARQELARRYLYQGRWNEAGELFDQFAASDDSAARAFGLAGQSIVLAKQHDFDASARRLGEFWPLHEQLDDPRLARLLRVTLQDDLRASQSSLGRQEADALKQWLDEDLHLDSG